jgi:asparagine synthase (glutamine-hydrolysing)
MVETLVAGLYDPRRTLTPERARALVESALVWGGPVEVVQRGAFTVGVTPAGAAQPATAPDRPLCVLEGRMTLGSGPVTDEPWATEADVAAAWEGEGESMLGRARGSFLLALFDERREYGILARDQLGERPLLWHGGSRLAFASDYRPLLDLVSPRPAPDAVAVSCWLGLAVPSNGRTFFEGVHRLKPGHLIELRGEAWTPRSYWVPRYRAPFGDPVVDLIPALRQEMERATAGTLRGVDSAGVLLSGGLDSSTVAALAAPQAQRSGKSLRAYSAVFPGLESADESAYIDDSLQNLRLSGTRMAVHGGSLLAGSLRYARTSMAPDISANNFFWVDLLRQAAGEGVEVLLDGEGGDELFKTAHYLIADELRRGNLRMARLLVRNFPTLGGRMGRGIRWRVLGRYGVAGMLPYWVHRAVPMRPYSSPLGLTAPARRSVRRESDLWGWKRHDGPRWWAQLVDGMVYGPDNISGPDHALRIARMAGVQRRRPLLDLDLVEHVLRLPPAIGFQPMFARGHMRLAMQGALPESVIHRREKSFFTDVRVRSLVESDLDAARHLLGPKAEVRRFVRAEVIEEALAGPSPGASLMERGTWGFRLQHLGATELWLQLQADPGASEEALLGRVPDPARYVLQPQGPGD